MHLWRWHFSHAVQFSYLLPQAMIQSGSLSHKHTHTHAESHTFNLHLSLCCIIFFFLKLKEGLWATFVLVFKEKYVCAKSFFFFGHKPAALFSFLNIFVFCVFKSRCIPKIVDQFTCLTFFFFCLSFLLTHTVGACLWSAPFQMDVSHQNPTAGLSYRGLGAARFRGLDQCGTGKTVAGFWVVFWISEHKMAHLHFCSLSVSIRECVLPFSSFFFN